MAKLRHARVPDILGVGGEKPDQISRVIRYGGEVLAKTGFTRKCTDGPGEGSGAWLKLGQAKNVPRIS